MKTYLQKQLWRNIFHALLLIVISNWSCRAIIIPHDRMQYFLLSGSGRGDLIPYSSAFFATIPRLELMPSLSRIPSSFPIRYPCRDFSASRFTRRGQNSRIPSGNFAFLEFRTVIRSNWPDLLPRLLKCRILLSTAPDKSLFIEY